MPDSGFGSLGTKTPKSFTVISSAAETVTLVEAVENRRIRLLTLTLSASTTGSVDFKSGTTIIGPFTFTDPTLNLARSADGHFETEENEPLKLTNTDGVTLRGFGRYVEV